MLEKPNPHRSIKLRIYWQQKGDHFSVKRYLCRAEEMLNTGMSRGQIEDFAEAFVYRKKTDES